MRRAILASTLLLSVVVLVSSAFALDAGVPAPTPPLLATTSSSALAGSVLSTEAVPVQSTSVQVGEIVESVAPSLGQANSGGGGAESPPPTESSAAAGAESGSSSSEGSSSTAPVTVATKQSAPSSTPAGSDDPTAQTSYGGGFYTPGVRDGSASSSGAGKGSGILPATGSGANQAPIGAAADGKGVADGLVESGLGAVGAGAEGSAGQSDGSGESQETPVLVPTAVPGPGLAGLVLVLAGLPMALQVWRRKQG